MCHILHRPVAFRILAQTRKAPSRVSFVRYRGYCGTRHRRLEKGKPAISAPIQSNRSATPSLLSLLRRPRPHPIGRPPPSLLARWNRWARSHLRRRTSDETKPSTLPSSSRDAAALASRTCDPGESCARLPTPHPLSPSPVPPTLVVKPQPSLDRALGVRLRQPHPNPPPIDNPSSQSSIFLIKQCVKTQFCYCFDDNT